MRFVRDVLFSTTEPHTRYRLQFPCITAHNRISQRILSTSAASRVSTSALGKNHKSSAQIHDDLEAGSQEKYAEIKVAATDIYAECFKESLKKHSASDTM